MHICEDAREDEERSTVNSQPTVLLPFQPELTQTAWGSSNIANGAALHAPKHSIVLRETKGENKRRGGEDAGVSEYPSVEAGLRPACPDRISGPTWFVVYADRRVNSVISGGTPRRTGIPKVPKPRLTYR